MGIRRFASLLTIALVVSTQGHAAEVNPLWDLKLMNTNACARESAKPATSFFLYVDGLTVGRAVAKLAQTRGVDVGSSVQAGWTELHRGVHSTVRKTLRGLLSKRLPLVRSLEEVNPVSIELIDHEIPTDLDKPTCHRIKKAFPAVVDANRVKEKELEQLAKAYVGSGENVDSCDLIATESAAQPELALRFDLGDEAFKTNDLGFQFWESFKIYLTAVWAQGLTNTQAPRFGSWIASFPIEDMTLLIPDGCRSIARPECRSDFLSQSQLTRLLSSKDFSDSGLMMRDLSTPLLEEAPRVRERAITPLADPTKTMKDLSRLRQQATKVLVDSQISLAAIFSTKKVATLVSEIEASLDDRQSAAWDQLESACVENQVFADPKMSAMARELQANGKLVRILDGRGFPGTSASASLANVFDLTAKMTSICDENRMELLNGRGAAGSRAWVIDYFSATLSSETVNGILKTSVAEETTYISVAGDSICTSPIACWREAMEAATRLYQVALTESVTHADDGVLSTDLSLNGSAAVACRAFDPWAESHRKFKKLLLDTASAVATGALQIPIYLDLNPTTPKVASFRQLVETNTVKLDPVFYKQGWEKTMYLDLGSFVDAPCSISVSKDANVAAGDRSFMFKGISAGLCSSKTEVATQQDATGVTTGRISSQGACARCSINFHTVSSAVSRHGFGPVGAGLRMLGALINFFRSSKDPALKPKTLVIDPQELVRTYQANGNSIPKRCVGKLTQDKACKTKQQKAREPRGAK